MARIRDRRMKIAGYISILILLALGCAGRADKMKTDSGTPGVMAQREGYSVNQVKSN